jgi:hypothetical protein
MRTPGEHLGPQQKRQSVVPRLPVSRDLPESDWQTFRQLREVALERLCKRVLEPDELARFTAGTRTAIEKSNPIPG